MKQLKKWMLVLMCAGTMMSVTACGSDKNAKDNEATQDQNHTGKDQDRDMADDEDSKMDDAGKNDAVEDGNRDGVADEIGKDIKDGARDIKEDAENGVNEMMDENDPDKTTR